MRWTSHRNFLPTNRERRSVIWNTVPEKSTKNGSTEISKRFGPYFTPHPNPITKRGLKVVQKTIFWTVCDSDSRSPFKRCLKCYRIFLKKMRSTPVCKSHFKIGWKMWSPFYVFNEPRKQSGDRIGVDFTLPGLKAVVRAAEIAHFPLGTFVNEQFLFVSLKFAWSSSEWMKLSDGTAFF